MDNQKLKNIIEALLIVAEQPLSIKQLLELIDEPAITSEQINQVIGKLQSDFQERGFQLVEVASGYRFQVNSEYQTWLNRLLEEKPHRYSKALLETLAIIAYRQPVTRADIESVRGIAVSSHMIKTLLEREWIRVVGHRDVPGKPSIFATTKTFLDYFNLKSLNELPPLSEIKDMNDIIARGESAMNQVAMGAEESAELVELLPAGTKEISETTLDDLTAQPFTANQVKQDNEESIVENE